MHPETVSAVHDIAWRAAEAESRRTDGIDRKAATLATFASLLTSLTATLGFRFVEVYPTVLSLLLLGSALAALAGAVFLAVRALWPTEFVGLNAAHLERLPTWSIVLRPPEYVQGAVARSLIRALARERQSNDRKVVSLRRGLVCLIGGLVLVVLQTATLAVREVG